MLRSIKYGAIGAVLAGLVGGTAAAWPTPDKTVTLVLDGRSSTLHTPASTVSGVLAGAGYHLSTHDLVAPSAGARIHSGGTIVYKRGRLLHLSVDGVSRTVWTTAPTVSVALAQLGFTTANFTSVSRSRRLPLSASDITIRTPKFVTVRHDGRTQSVTTTDATAGRVLHDLGIVVGTEDRLSVLPSSPLSNGTQIVVTRVTRTTVTQTMAVPFPTHKTKDPSLASGKTKIVTPGQAGKVRITYAVVYVDGKLAGKTKIDAKILDAAITQLEKIGTKQPVDASGAAPAGSAQEIAKQLLAKRGWSSQFSCLQEMWNHESGWRVNAENPGSGAYGIPQALPGSKMASAGSDWRTSARTQIIWGLNYIAARYHDPCGAWATWQAHGGWY